MTDPAGRRTGSTPPGLVAAVGVLLALPLLALLWVSSYNKEEPRLGGVPFFYWYQFLWILITPILTNIAYVVIKRARARR